MSDIARILIVDDNPKYLKDALPMYGYDVVAVTDGLQALKLLGKKEKFDLILLDVMMPNMNGWETLKAIRNQSDTETIPVIMLSAVNEDQKIVSGLKIGADDYITKPFILPNLLARIEAVLRRTNWNKKTDDMNINIDFATDEPITPLTPKEVEVLSYAAKGASNEEIADKMFVRSVTVKTHLNSIFKKLKVKNRTQATLLAIQLKLIEK